MTPYFAFFALVATLMGCDIADGPERLVPDDTPFVVGIVEVSTDTVLHHTQVYVGRVSDPGGRSYSSWQEFGETLYNRIYTADLWAQVIIKTDFLHIRPEPESDADVNIIGPLGATTERTVYLAHEGDGVYGDVDRALPLVLGGNYRLEVVYSDGTQYQAHTRVPGAYTVSLEDTLTFPTQLVQHGPGQWTEVAERKPVACTPSPDPDAPLSTWTSAEHKDVQAASFILDSPDQLPFAHRGDHLRVSGTSIMYHGAYPDGMVCTAGWGIDSNTQRWDSYPAYFRAAQISDDLARYYEVAYPDFSSPDPPSGAAKTPYDEIVQTARADADLHRDGRYLFGITNIQAVDASDPAPTGIFGGISTRYLSTIVRPDRSYDPDTLGWTYHPSARP